VTSIAILPDVEGSEDIVDVRARRRRREESYRIFRRRYVDVDVAND
jgi:hypothetical protein